MKDLMGLMKQAQELQGRMKEAQEKLDAESVTGESGAGLVRITLSGKGDIRDIALDPSILVASEKEVVEDLIKAAFDRSSPGAGDERGGGRIAAAARLFLSGVGARVDPFRRT